MLRLERGAAARLYFSLLDGMGTPITGAGVAAQISRDGAPFVPAMGAGSEIGAGVYSYAGTASDFAGESFALLFEATGARSTIFGITTTTADDLNVLMQNACTILDQTAVPGTDTGTGSGAFTNADRETLNAIIARFAAAPPGPLDVIPALSDPAMTVAHGITRTARGARRGKMAVKFQLISVAGNGSIFERGFAVSSDEDGLLTTALARGAIYRAQTGSGQWVEFQAPDAPSFEIPNLVG